MNEIRLPNGDYTASDEEVLECLFNTRFPGCVDIAFTESNVFSCSYESLASARDNVTTETIQWALNRFAAFKFPGADGIYPILLQRGFEIIKHDLKTLLPDPGVI